MSPKKSSSMSNAEPNNAAAGTGLVLSRYRYLVTLAVLLLAVVFVGSNGFQAASSCREFYRKDKVAVVGQTRLQLEVVKKSEDRQKGLSDRTCIDKGQGMLFVFEQSEYHRFWMKDMRFAVDMIWIDSSKKVVSVRANVQPATYPKTFTSDKPALYVLEIGAGQARAYGIYSGTLIKF